MTRTSGIVVLSRCIAIVIDPWDFPFNGTVVSTRRFVKALEHQFNFKLLATPDSAQPPDARTVAFKRISVPGLNGLLKAMRVPLAMPDSGLIRKALQDVDLLHVQFPFFLGFAVISEARRQGIPVVCSFHVQPENLLLNLGIRSRLLTKLIYKIFVAGFYNRANLVIAPSEFAAEALRANGLTTPVRVISNGVPEHFLNLQRQPLCAGTEQTAFTILSVGRLAREKQHRVLLEAIALSKYRNTIKLNIIGAGPLEKKLKNLVRQLQINVTIESVSDDVLLDLYARADLFVHTGDIELEGMSVVEAMAAGNAVLVSDSADSATGSLVSSKQALFKHGDAKHLASQIDFWLASPEVRSLEGQANRDWAAQRTHSLPVSQVASMYDEMAQPLLSESFVPTGDRGQ